MIEEIKSMASVILETIKKSNKVLLHCHPYPDPDSIGSVLAMTAILKNMGKDVTPIIGDSDFPNNLVALPHHDWIQPKKYQEVDLSEFDLFIILDSSSPGQISQLTEVTFPDSMVTIVIDHHTTNLRYGKINLVEPTYSSTSQILYELFLLWQVEVDVDTAICLFMGIFADTGGFKYQNTTAETLHVASELAKINSSFPAVIFEMENNRSAQEIEYTGLALSSLEKYFSNNVVIATVPFKELKKRGIAKEDTQVGIGDIIRSVVGWNIGVNLVETEPNVVTVSLRTRDSDKYDVSRVAKSVGKNGGGHKAAAGTTIYEPFDVAKKMLLDAIAKAYPELGGI